MYLGVIVGRTRAVGSSSLAEDDLVVSPEQLEKFLESFEKLKSTNRGKVDIDVEKCTDLPELENESIPRTGLICNPLAD